MKSICDRSFRYVPSIETDLKKTFARLRREQRSAQMKVEAETQQKLRPIRPIQGKM